MAALRSSNHPLYDASEVSMSIPAATTHYGRRGLWRWAVALVATVMLVVSGSGLVVFAQSGAGESRGPQFVPADATAYVEARMDMPDGQAEALAEFMTAFPGFADAGAFQLKLDEVLDGLISDATDGAIVFSGEMESFLTGEIGLALMDVVDASMGGGDPEMLVGIAISDRAGAESFVELLTADPEAPIVEEAYSDTSIISKEDASLAVTDEWILLSPTADLVKTGIDVLGGEASLADDADFMTAMARVPSSRLGAAYLDVQSLAPLVDLAGMAASGEAGLELPTDDLAALLPENMVAYLAADTDRLTLEAFITPGAPMDMLAVGESDLASLFPADTQLYVETRELGMLLESSLEGLLTTMDEEAAQQIAPIESMLGVPLPEFLDFLSDAAVGASLNSDGLWVGIAAEVTDDATAASRVERLMSIVRLLGAGAETGIAVEETSIGDATVTVITVPTEDLTAGAGLPIDIGDTISITVSDGTLLIGSGDFVETALTLAPVDSLGASAGYTDALGDDTVNAGVLYANVSSLLTEIDPLIGLMVPEWADIQPYVTGLDRLIAVGGIDDEVISTRMTVIVNQ